MSQSAEYLTRKETAAYISGQGIRITASTLNKYARTGMGPAFIRQTETSRGRVFYSRTSISEWLAEIDPTRRRMA